MIYPCKLSISGTQEEKSFWESAKDSAKGWWNDFIGNRQASAGSKSSDTKISLFAEFEVPEMEDTRKLCLREYLQSYSTIFESGMLDPSVKAMNIIDDIKTIFKCLQSPKIQDGTPNRYHRTLEWKSISLEEVS